MDKQRIDSYNISAARNLRSARLLYGVDMIVRVEDKDDIPFWQSMLSTVIPGRKLKFLPCTLSSDGQRHSGKTICMKYVGTLDKHFCICVDSDFDNILQPGLLAAEKYIFQTYTYSWENHYCHIQQLQQQWEKFRISDFDFACFISHLSKIIYPPLVALLTAKDKGIKAWSLDAMCSAILSIQPTQKLLLADNGELLCQRIAEKLTKLTEHLKHIDEEDIDAMRHTAETAGLCISNAYLYMQGHCIYNLIHRIGNALSDGKIDFKAEVLDHVLSTSGYKEVDNIVRDIKRMI